MKSKILTLLVFHILCSNAAYSQTSYNRKAEAAVQTFYKKYLPMLVRNPRTGKWFHRTYRHSYSKRCAAVRV